MFRTSSWKRWAAKPKLENFLENMAARLSGISGLKKENNSFQSLFPEHLYVLYIDATVYLFSCKGIPVRC
jgi:hypothetical protein